jgi:hypothetical protein
MFESTFWPASGRPDLNRRPLDPQEVGVRVSARHARHAPRRARINKAAVQQREAAAVPKWSQALDAEEHRRPRASVGFQQA